MLCLHNRNVLASAMYFILYQQPQSLFPILKVNDIPHIIRPPIKAKWTTGCDQPTKVIQSHTLTNAACYEWVKIITLQSISMPCHGALW